MNFGRKYVNVPSPQTKEKMMAKKYKVTRTFTDKAGKTWQEGQDYSGDETEARNQANQGNLEESSESGKPQPK